MLRNWTGGVSMLRIFSSLKKYERGQHAPDVFPQKYERGQHLPEWQSVKAFKDTLTFRIRPLFWGSIYSGISTAPYFS